MEWQLYWPHWWKLWPRFNTEVMSDLESTYTITWFFFGPLQCYWYGGF